SAPKSEGAADQLRYLLERDVAILSEEERGRRRLVDSEHVEISQIVNMYVRVAVETFTEVDARPYLSGECRKLQDLIPIRLPATPCSVVQGRDAAHGPNAFTKARLGYVAVDRDTRPPEGDRLEVRVLGEHDRTRVLAAGVVGDDARAAGVNEQLAATLERRNECFGGAGMIGVCGMDHGIGLACAVCPGGRSVQSAEDWCDPALLQETSLLFRPDQAQDFMSGVAKPFCDGATDVARCPSDKESHGFSLRLAVVAAVSSSCGPATGQSSASSERRIARPTRHPPAAWPRSVAGP